MSRPLYENENTKTAEEEVAKFIGELWGVSHQKLPKQYYVDFALMRDGYVRGWAEIKTRKCTRLNYKTYMIGLKKVVNGIKLSETTGMKFVLVVDWIDCTGFLHIKDLTGGEIKIGGRFDRNDPEDIEPVIHYDTECFVIIRSK